MDVKKVAFDLAFNKTRSPLVYEQLSNEQITVKIKSLLPSSSEQECLDVITKVRKLCDDVYKVCNAYRDGKLGKDQDGVKKAIIELQKNNPGFSTVEYNTAFATGLLWTAF